MTPGQLADLHARCFETPRPWSTAEISALLDDTSVFVCLRDEGFALGRAAAGEAELLTLAVEPCLQGRGIGKNLLRAFEEAARDRSALVAFLEVSADNPVARRLYQASGYEESGRRPKYYRSPDGQRIDAVVMAKSLTSG